MPHGPEESTPRRRGSAVRGDPAELRRSLLYTVISVSTRESLICAVESSCHSSSQRRPSCCWSSPECPHMGPCPKGRTRQGAVLRYEPVHPARAGLRTLPWPGGRLHGAGCGHQCCERGLRRRHGGPLRQPQAAFCCLLPAQARSCTGTGRDDMGGWHVLGRPGHRLDPRRPAG